VIKRHLLQPNLSTRTTIRELPPLKTVSEDSDVLAVIQSSSLQHQFLYKENGAPLDARSPMVAYLFQPWLEYLCTLFVKFACAKSLACGHMDHEIDSANYKKGSGNEQNRWTNFRPWICATPCDTCRRLRRLNHSDLRIIDCRVVSRRIAHSMFTIG
jgi:hypothetical protein